MRRYAVTERFVLHVGYGCNERCAFCYYLPEIESGRARAFTTRQLLRRIDFAAWYGKRAVDVTGGEPTLRPDLPRLLERCRERGLEKVTLITNGVRTASSEYARSLRDAGLTEGLFSLHGATAAMHDGLTRRPGSFERLLLSLGGFRELGLGLRINTVVMPENAGEVEGVFELVSPYGPAAVNLLVFNPAESASQAPARVDYAEVGERLSAALDRWKGRFPAVNVRFLPYCFLPRHPDAIRTQWQKAHEDVEWDPFLNVLFQKGAWAAAGAVAAGALARWGSPSYRAADPQTWLSKSLSACRMKLFYRHGPACRGCAARRICPGLPRAHVARSGFPESAPLTAPEAIVDPLRFVHEQTERFASLRRV